MSSNSPGEYSRGTAPANLRNLIDKARIIVVAVSQAPAEKLIVKYKSMLGAHQEKAVFFGVKHFGYNLNPFARVPMAQRPAAGARVIDAVIAENNEPRDHYGPVAYVDLVRLLGQNGTTVLVFDAEGRPLSPDRLYLTRCGAIEAGKRLLAERPDVIDRLWQDRSAAPGPEANTGSKRLQGHALKWLYRTQTAIIGAPRALMLSVQPGLIKMKRLFDFVLGLVLAPVALVTCLLVALPIAIESRASPLFFQTRLGFRERPFRLLKLRTMHVATPSVASHEVGASNILVTGRLLRRLKIDELPQVWNVLNGTMSFVGPRPGLPNQLDLLEARRRHGVFSLVPGITGVAQINGIDMSTPEKLAAADKAYNRPWSLMRDLRILWATGTGAGSGDAATGKAVR